MEAGCCEKHTLSWKMLEHNTIEGFLPFKYYYLDDKLCFRYYYEKNTRMEEYLQKKEADYTILRNILTGIASILEKGEEYLLDPSGYVIKPEWVFWDSRKEKVFVCYLPGNEGELQKDFVTLTEYLMKHTDHKDKKGVKLIYGVYDLAMTERITGDVLKKYLEEWEEEKEELYPIANDRKKEENSKKEETPKKEEIRMVLERVRGKKHEFDSLWNREEKERIVIKGEKTITLGRGKECHVSIPYAQISKRHISIEKKGNGYYIMDLGSTNGTRINQKRMPPNVSVQCRENDILTLADISYEIRG